MLASDQKSHHNVKHKWKCRLLGHKADPWWMMHLWNTKQISTVGIRCIRCRKELVTIVNSEDTYGDKS